MTRFIFTVLIATAIAGVGSAQQWELGGGAGWGFAMSTTVKNADGTADAGPGRGLVATAYGGNHMHNRLSGEVRYLFRKGNPRVWQGGTLGSIAGESHTVLYDFLVHFTDKGSRVRPFIAAGGGAKIFRATGIEDANQPLDDFILLTKKTETKPVFSAGAGIAVLLTDTMVLRFDFRDHMSTFPDKIYQEAPGASRGGWLHDFSTTVTIGATF